MGAGADFAELYFEDKDELNIKRDGGAVRGVSRATIYGAGLYLMLGTRSVYYYTNDVSLLSLTDGANQAGGFLRRAAGRRAVGQQEAMRQAAERDGRGPVDGGSGAGESADAARPTSFTFMEAHNPCPVRTHPSAVSHAAKVRLLENVEKAARAESGDVKHVTVEYFDTDQRVTVVNTEGVWAEDSRVTSRFRLAPTLVNEKGTLARWKDYVRPAGFETFDDDGYVEFSRRLVRDIRDRMYADEAPAGYFPVVLDAGPCGAFFHEACGHQLESQSVAWGNSVFAGKIGQRVGCEKLTVVDDGSWPGLYGSAAIDDEGMPRQRNVLVERGVLGGYLVDRLGSRKLCMPRTGSGRRQGYSYAPAARMTNTYLEAGPDDDDEMITSLAEGLFVTELGGGTGGAEFTLMAEQAYWVKDGKIDRQVKGAMLVGKGAETLFRIDRVGRTLKLDDGGGFCGGASGLCPTTAFQPRIRVMGMVVGGKGRRR